MPLKATTRARRQLLETLPGYYATLSRIGLAAPPRQADAHVPHHHARRAAPGHATMRENTRLTFCKFRRTRLLFEASLSPPRHFSMRDILFYLRRAIPLHFRHGSMQYANAARCN